MYPKNKKFKRSRLLAWTLVVSGLVAAFFSGKYSNPIRPKQELNEDLPRQEKVVDPVTTRIVKDTISGVGEIFPEYFQRGEEYSLESVVYENQEGDNRIRIILAKPCYRKKSVSNLLYLYGEGEQLHNRYSPSEGDIFLLVKRDGSLPKDINPNRKMAPDLTSEASFERWQENARKKLIELLMDGSLPQKTPLDTKIQILEEYSEESKEYIKELEYNLYRVSYSSKPDKRVEAVLATPKNTKGKRVPGILVVPGHWSKPIALFRKGAYGDMMAKEGHVVISPDIVYYGFGDPKHFEIHTPNWSQNGERVWDCMRALDILYEQENVDQQKIGTVGWSLGGQVAMYLSALDLRVKGAVISCALFSYNTEKLDGCRCSKVNNFEEYFDYPDIYSLIAPRPLAIETGSADTMAPLDSSLNLFGIIQEAYKITGSEENLIFSSHPGGHRFYGTVSIPFLSSRLKQ